MSKSKGNGITTGELAIIGLTVAGLWVATRQTGSTPGAPGGTTILREISNGIGGALGTTASGIASVPADIVISGTKKAVSASETRTSQETFGGQTYSNVSAFMATGNKKGDVFANPVTYEQFIQAQPIAFRGAVSAGNIITNNEAANYGGFVASETKKGISAAGRNPDVFSNLDARQQAFVAFGQAVSVPFGGGGAAAWGAGLRSWMGI